MNDHRGRKEALLIKLCGYQYKDALSDRDLAEPVYKLLQEWMTNFYHDDEKNALVCSTLGSAVDSLERTDNWFKRIDKEFNEDLDEALNRIKDNGAKEAIKLIAKHVGMKREWSYEVEIVVVPKGGDTDFVRELPVMCVPLTSGLTMVRFIKVTSNVGCNTCSLRKDRKDFRRPRPAEILAAVIMRTKQYNYQ